MKFESIVLQVLFMALSIGLWAQPVTITPPEAFINPGESVQLTASGATYYQWSPAIGLSSTDGPVTVASPMVTTTYTCNGFALGEDQVVNGNFDQGNVGFISDYTFSDNVYPESTYAVGANAHDFHPDFIGTGHGGTGNFMIVNGSTTPNTNVWTEQITVNPDTYYAFSTWVCTVSAAGDVARLQFSINGNQLGEVFSAPSYTGEWLQFYELWYSDNTTAATITILNQNTSGSGNDFGLDDISFCELVLVGEPQCTVHVDTMTASAFADDTELCEGNSTVLHVQASGGSSNYSYTWTPASSLDDPTSANPVATPEPGSTTYSCHVSDGIDALDVSVTLFVYPHNDTLVVDPSICFGQAYDFHGTPYDQDGQIAYFDTIDGHGCLKVEKLILSVDEYQKPPVLYQFECYEYGTTPAWDWEKTGTTYHEDTYDEIVLDDPEGGCPILHRLDLKFHEDYYHEENKTACNSYYWPITGVTYTENQEGITQTFQSAFGDQLCDSTFVLNLTIANYETNEELVPYEETCDSYLWDPAGHTYVTDDEYDPENHVYTVSGTYQRTYQNQMGCDSIVTMQVEFEYAPHPDEITAIDSTGTFSHWVITATEFQINSYDFTVTDVNPECHWDTVVWSCEDAPQWVLEPFGEIGENCRLYVLNRETDTVWLRARAYNRCAPEGIEQKYWLLCSFYDLDEQHLEAKVYPNPTRGMVTVEAEAIEQVKVVNLLGQVVENLECPSSNRVDVNLANHPASVYLLEVRTKDGCIKKRIVLNH